MYQPFHFGEHIPSEVVVGTVTWFLQQIEPADRDTATLAVGQRFPGIHPEQAEEALSSYPYPV
jgi:hypothetical protein